MACLRQREEKHHVSEIEPIPDVTINPEETRELLIVASEVVRAIDDLRQEMVGTKRYGRRNRQLIRWIVASLVFDILLSLGLAVAVTRANAATRRAERAASAQVVACRAGNEARALQTELWNTILSYPPPLGETAAEALQREGRVAEFRRYVATAFRQQDCAALSNE